MTFLTLAALPAQAANPPAGQPARLGVFRCHDGPAEATTWAGCRRGLAAAGLQVETIERCADGDTSRALAQLAELRQRGCQVILALGTEAALLAKAHAPDVPVVFAAVPNAVAAGLVTDWQAPGGRCGGASSFVPPRAVLDTFRHAVPQLRRLGVLRAATAGTVSAAEVATLRQELARGAAPPVTLHESLASDAADLPRAIAALREAAVDAIWLPIDRLVEQHVGVVQRELGPRPCPLLTTSDAILGQGAAVVGVSVDFDLHGRRVAARLLATLRDGESPGERPVDRLQSHRVGVDLAAARRAGLELPLSLLLLADELRHGEGQDGKH